MSDLGALLRWLLALEVIGWGLFPLLYLAVPGLRDRGLTVAKPFALLLLVYPVWFLAALGLPLFTTPILLVAGLLLAALGWTLALRQRPPTPPDSEDDAPLPPSAFRLPPIAAFLRESWRYVILAEIVFIGAFFFYAWLRGYNPEISGTEKPMEIGFLSAATRQGDAAADRSLAEWLWHQLLLPRLRPRRRAGEANRHLLLARLQPRARHRLRDDLEWRCGGHGEFAGDRARQRPAPAARAHPGTRPARRLSADLRGQHVCGARPARSGSRGDRHVVVGRARLEVIARGDRQRLPRVDLRAERRAVGHDHRIPILQLRPWRPACARFGPPLHPARPHAGARHLPRPPLHRPPYRHSDAR